MPAIGKSVRLLRVDYGPMLRSKAAIRFAVSTMSCDWPQLAEKPLVAAAS